MIQFLYIIPDECDNKILIRYLQPCTNIINVTDVFWQCWRIWINSVGDDDWVLLGVSVLFVQGFIYGLGIIKYICLTSLFGLIYPMQIDEVHNLIFVRTGRPSYVEVRKTNLWSLRP